MHATKSILVDAQVATAEPQSFFQRLLGLFSRGQPGVCSTCKKTFEPDPEYPAYASTCDKCAEYRIAI